ncbi:mitochondrial sodium/calcium exchanger protein-like [Dysidea avara]|uniref:mitochondrial sodium/calcium exchanger protein-like n=1 Tax=Dysidea avara TaxID=196820 RepID=UPI003331C5DA
MIWRMRYLKTLWTFGMLFCCLQSFIGAATTIQAHSNTTNPKPDVKSPLWTVNESCSRVHDIPANRKCAFVRNVTACQPDGGLINYFVFTHCWMPNNLVPLSAVIMFIWLLYLFIFLGATAEDYFCPALKVMSDNLRLNQNLAGVTLLALGNGAPDIFGAYAAITHAKGGDAGLAIGAIFGAGIFVTTIVVGGVVFSFSFTLTQRPFLRDVIFYIIAVFATFFVMWDHKVYWWEGAGFIVLYVVYVLVVFIGRLVYQKFLKKTLGQGDIPRLVKSPVGKELGENGCSPPHSPTNDSDYHSLSNAPMSPTARSFVSRDFPKEFPPLREETEDSEDHSVPAPVRNQRNQNQHNDLEEIQQLEDSYEDQIYDLSMEGHDLEHSMHTSNEIITSSNESLDNPTAILPKAKSYRNVRRTLSGALEVGGYLGVSVAARASPHMERRHTPQEEEQQQQRSTENTPLIPPFFRPVEKPDHPAVKMLKALSPIDSDFKYQKIWWKILTIVKAPITVLLALTVPVVDDSETDHCWNKWLNVCHCVISPCFIFIITEAGFKMIGGVFPVGGIPLVLGLIVAVVVALTSKNDCPPVYHFLFAWLGFGVAIVWIYILANEIVNMLQALGIIINLTDAILGLTLLAWGNSIGDAISNYTMAKQGFPRMAIGACFGGPLLNMLIGIGVASVVKATEDPRKYFDIEFSDVEFFCVCFLLLSLVSSLVVVTLVLRFKMRRWYGIWLLALYGCFMVTAILAGVNVIHVKHTLY